MTAVFVGVGSNIEPRQNVERGLRLLGEHFPGLRRSTVYRTRSVGFSAEDFLNLVVVFETRLEPEALVQILHRIEERVGRKRAETGLRSRTLDLDLLLYGSEAIETGGIRLPRPDILKYAFVLKPLAELAGDRTHPVLGRSFMDLWAEFADETQELHPVAWNDGTGP